MKRLLKILLVAVGVFALAIGAFTIWGYMPVATFEPLAYEPIRPDYWPIDGWRHATPEEQGMSSEELASMIEAYESAKADDDGLYLDSLTVIRNGYVVADVYFNPLFERGETHVLHSVSKSIVSALIGIAIDRGDLASVDEPLVEIFSDRAIQNLDQRKRRLTVRDLLSMETGLHSRDSYLYAYEGLFAMQHSDDWLQYALDLPMTAEPGERYDYSNISTFLLGAVLRQTTGQDPLDFAREHLFSPLGIQGAKWEWNADGYPMAWARMWLRPEDMAKIGLLYLQQGRWEGQQILPTEWVRESLTPHAYQKNAVDILNADQSKNREASTQNWVAQRFIRPFADGYGYQWWLDRKGNFSAVGTSGQFLTVSPEHNLIFVVTSKSTGIAQFYPAKLFYEHVLPAVQANAPLPPEPVAAAKLEALAGPPTYSQPTKLVATLPAIASRISGATYRLEKNPFNTDNISLSFDRASNVAYLNYTARESWNIECEVGLDGVHRISDSNPSRVAARGNWISDNTFSVDIEILGYSTFDSWDFTFEGNEIEVTERSISGEYTYRGQRLTD